MMTIERVAQRQHHDNTGVRFVGSCDVRVFFDVLHADWALGVAFQPGVDAAAMEGVEAWQQSQFLSVAIQCLTHSTCPGIMMMS